ncbi:hypothetical protein BHM03_00059451 [Ensete ventricosum]|nr:hypothetical protein BHM03_00059451 [Ensete ventricosum]
MKALVINIWGLWDLIIQRYDRCGWRVGLLQCSHSLKGARHVIGQGRHRGESSKIGQAGPLPQAAACGLQVQTRSQTAGAAHEECGSEHDEREVGYSPRAEEAQSGALTGKRSHKERLSTVETRLNVLEASLKELYQGQGRLLGVESSQEEAESRIDRVESLVDQLTEGTKDSL